MLNPKIRSYFEADGIPVTVTTLCHPHEDMIACSVSSDLITSGQDTSIRKDVNKIENRCFIWSRFPLLDFYLPSSAAARINGPTDFESFLPFLSVI